MFRKGWSSNSLLLLRYLIAQAGALSGRLGKVFDPQIEFDVLGPFDLLRCDGKDFEPVRIGEFVDHRGHFVSALADDGHAQSRGVFGAADNAVAFTKLNLSHLDTQHTNARRQIALDVVKKS